MDRVVSVSPAAALNRTRVTGGLRTKYGHGEPGAPATAPVRSHSPESPLSWPVFLQQNHSVFMARLLSGDLSDDVTLSGSLDRSVKVTNPTWPGGGAVYDDGGILSPRGLPSVTGWIQHLASECIGPFATMPLPSREYDFCSSTCEYASTSKCIR